MRKPGRKPVKAKMTLACALTDNHRLRSLQKSVRDNNTKFSTNLKFCNILQADFQFLRSLASLKDHILFTHCCFLLHSRAEKVPVSGKHAS